MLPLGCHIRGLGQRLKIERHAADPSASVGQQSKVWLGEAGSLRLMIGGRSALDAERCRLI